MSTNAEFESIIAHSFFQVDYNNVRAAVERYNREKTCKHSLVWNTEDQEASEEFKQAVAEFTEWIEFNE